MERMTAQADTVSSSVVQCLLDWPKGLLWLLNYANATKLCLFALNGVKVKLNIVALNRPYA